MHRIIAARMLFERDEAAPQRNRRIGWSTVRLSPARTSTSAITQSRSALRMFSIFIASITASFSPAIEPEVLTSAVPGSPGVFRRPACILPDWGRRISSTLSPASFLRY